MKKHRPGIYSVVVGIALLLLFIIPSTASAEITVTNGTTSKTSASFTAPYTTKGTPLKPITFYAWFGEYGTPLSQWNRTSLKGATINAGDSAPKTFAIQFEFSDLGMVAGKKYAYRLSSQTTVDGALFYSSEGTSKDRCFTTTEGEVPCESSPNMDPTIAVNKGQISATTAVFTVTFSGTADRDYSFNVTYSKKGASTSTPSEACYFEVATQFFKSTGAKSCIITITGLSPESEYSYFLQSNPVIPALKDAINGVFTTTKQTTANQPNDKKLTLKIDSVYAPATTVIMNGSLLSTLDAVVPDGQLRVYYGISSEFLTQSVEVYTGDLTRPGITFSTISIPNLAVNTKYYYQFEELATGTSFGVRSFTTNTPGNQAIAVTTSSSPNEPLTGTTSFSGPDSNTTTINGECGTAINKPVPVVQMITDPLCSKGTPSEVLGGTSGPWSWTCIGSVGGSTAPCSLSSTSGTVQPSSYLKNPLAPGLDSFPKIFAAVYNGIVLPVAVPFIAIMIMYSGFLFVMARRSGKADGITEAKKTFKWTIIGAVLLLGGFVVANALQGTLCQLLSNCPSVQQVP